MTPNELCSHVAALTARVRRIKPQWVGVAVSVWGDTPPRILIVTDGRDSRGAVGPTWEAMIAEAERIIAELETQHNAGDLEVDSWESRNDK